MSRITIKKLISPAEISEFWQKIDEYHQNDLYPNVELDEGETLEELVEHFDSQGYRDTIMDLHQNANLQFVFFYYDEEYLGFAMYKIYTTEDGKAIIPEFCIAAPFRNQGIGAAAYAELAKVLKQEGGVYAALNVSNSNNRRFWNRLGFKQREVDEWGEQWYVKPL